MTTRNIVPRADGEGSLGTAAKQWGAIRGKKIYVDGTDITEQVTETTAKAAEAAASAEAAEDSAEAAQSLYNALIAAYGYPLTATTAAGMTDTTKIYVYTGSEAGYTNGDWYYYDGNDWVSGGVYNAIAFNTDKTLSISGDAADAKVTGGKIKGLQSATTIVNGSIKTVSTAFINAVYQYCDNENNTSGEIWNYVSGDSPVPYTAAAYSRIPMFILPAGTYSVPLIMMFATQS